MTEAAAQEWMVRINVFSLSLEITERDVLGLVSTFWY